MIKVIDKKATGKTGRLLLLAKEQNGVVVCNNPDKIRAKAHNYGIVGVDIVSYEEYIDFLDDCGNDILVNRPIFIDELDNLLRQLDINIKGYSISEDE
jgi:hypothetical protein